MKDALPSHPANLRYKAVTTDYTKKYGAWTIDKADLVDNKAAVLVVVNSTMKKL